ncbi:hypothetical protein SCB17_001625 [Clostridium perfringens]|nr:hypothetical protein [Clostridium perfringens]MDU3844334.1 hypothetical protein [Clostridium perfringens]
MELIKVQRLHSRYKEFREDMKNEWEEYSYLNHCINNASTDQFILKSIISDNSSKKTKKDAGGMQNRFIRGGNTKGHFIASIGLFETYISFLAKVVFIDYPHKMSGNGTTEHKLFDLILNSDTKEEMIDRIAEEKVRSIFYGNPADVFLKDKCKLELGSTFSTDFFEAISLYQEITGRRNAIIHNSGRVDVKYLRENKESKFLEGQKIVISEDYLRGTIGLLMGIAAKTTECVIKKIYKGTIKGKLGGMVASFERCYKSGWYKKLLVDSTN